MLKRSLAFLLFCTAVCSSSLGWAQVSSGGPIPQDLNVFVALSKKVVPSVVNIQTLTTSMGNSQFYGQEEIFRKFFEDFFQQPGKRPDGGSPLPFPDGSEKKGKKNSKNSKPLPLSMGTGFVIDASGLILTNKHVVARADKINIQFSEKEDDIVEGKIIGEDPELDLALIKVETKRELIPLILGDSDQVQVGEFVMAVGNPIGHGHSVTHGIISAKGRTAPDFVLAQYLQTDAAINPGNSGGPLVNLKGEVIGINNAIDARAQGIGFAIPINLVKKVLPDLRTKGVVSRGFIGVNVDDMSPDLAKKLGYPETMRAPIVTHVFPGKPADKAGMKAMDVVTHVQDLPVKSAKEMIGEITKIRVGETARIKIRRAQTNKTLNVAVAERPTQQRMEEEEERESAKPPVSDPKEKLVIGLELVANGTEGVRVDNVIFDSAADRAGLARGDIILEVERRKVNNPDEFFNLVNEKKSYLLRVKRVHQGNTTFQVIILDLKDSQ